MPSQTLGAPPNRRAYGVRTTIEQVDVSAPHDKNRRARRARSRPQQPNRRKIKYRLISMASTNKTTSMAPANSDMTLDPEQPARAADLDLDRRLADPDHLYVAERVPLAHQAVVQKRDRLTIALDDGMEHVLVSLDGQRRRVSKRRRNRRRA